MTTKRLIPPFIFCPKCGDKLYLDSLDPETLEKIRQQGYDDGARGWCLCGVYAILLAQELPKEPSFTLCFNIYALTEEQKKTLIKQRTPKQI